MKVSTRVDPEVAKEYRAKGWWGDETLTDRIRRNAAATPEGMAFLEGDRRLTWPRYDERSSQLAGVLVDAGLAPMERVAVLLPDTPTVHVAFVAGEKAGLTVVGIGARAGEREIRHLLGRTQATAIVTHAEHRDRPAAELVDALRADLPLRHHVVVPDLAADELGDILVDGERATVRPAGELAALVEERRLGPDELFMVNSTSGTTGLPKCVMHTQNRWFYFNQEATAAGELSGDDVFMSIIPAPFGFGLWTAHFTPALLGAPCVIMERFNADEVLALIERERVTVLSCVSTQFIMMLNSPNLERHDLTSLRVMFTGGEAVPFDRAAQFEESLGASVLQFFGSNETGAFTRTTTEDTRDRRLRTAGKVLEPMQVRLYDEGRDVTGTGQPGQPAGRGPATCLGYLDDDEANDELFTEDGWMLMGDIAEIDDEGYLRLVGRKSDFIIRGGKNISALVVEDEVSTHPAVALAAAVAMPDPVFGERVCVYAQLRPGTSLTLDEVATHLEERGVGKENFPERLIVLDELPRSSGGKVAKGDLRADIRRRLEAGEV